MIRPPLDLDDALPRVDGDVDFLASLLDIFEEDFETRAASLAVALNRGDLGAAADIGHAIKGASANLGLPFLHGRAMDLEKAARSGDARTAKTSFASLEREFLKIVRYRKSHPLK